MESSHVSDVAITRTLAAPPARAYAAWLDPEIARTWLFATPKGTMVRAEIEPRVGGRFTLTDRRDGEDVEHLGEYLELLPPRRIVFTFQVPKYSPNWARVTVTIDAAGHGSELTLTHHGVPAEWVEGSRSGWGMVLDTLAAKIASS